MLRPTNHDYQCAALAINECLACDHNDNEDLIEALQTHKDLPVKDFVVWLADQWQSMYPPSVGG